MRRLGGLLSPSCWSVRTRVTVAATLIVALLLTAGAVFCYAAVRRTVYGGLRDRGTFAAADLATIVRETDPRGTLHVQDPDFTLLQVISGDREVLAASESLYGHGPLRAPIPRVPNRPEYHVVQVNGKRRVYLVSEKLNTRAGVRIVYAGAPVTQYTRYRGLLIGLLVMSALLAVGAVAVVVSLSVRWALRPVRVMSTELAEITGGADRRVTVPSPNDEVSELAESVNVTLNRLEDVLGRQRAFVADVSHELRSPLTGLRAQLEVLDDGAGIAPEDRERILWRFQRLPEARARDAGGTGLGLTISRDIARAHGGTLVAADSDRGARFVLRIPLAEP